MLEVPSNDTPPIFIEVSNAVAVLALPVTSPVTFPLRFPVTSPVIGPVTYRVESKVTASSTFNVPFTVVIAPEDATLTAPPPVANEVAPDDVNVVNEPVEAEFAPIVVPSIAPPSIFAEELIAFI